MGFDLFQLETGSRRKKIPSVAAGAYCSESLVTQVGLEWAGDCYQYLASSEWRQWSNQHNWNSECLGMHYVCLHIKHQIHSVQLVHANDDPIRVNNVNERSIIIQLCWGWGYFNWNNTRRLTMKPRKKSCTSGPWRQITPPSSPGLQKPTEQNESKIH